MQQQSRHLSLSPPFEAHSKKSFPLQPSDAYQLIQGKPTFQLQKHRGKRASASRRHDPYSVASLLSNSSLSLGTPDSQTSGNSPIKFKHMYPNKATLDGVFQNNGTAQPDVPTSLKDSRKKRDEILIKEKSNAFSLSSLQPAYNEQHHQRRQLELENEELRLRREELNGLNKPIMAGRSSFDQRLMGTNSYSNLVQDREISPVNVKHYYKRMLDSQVQKLHEKRNSIQAMKAQEKREILNAVYESKQQDQELAHSRKHYQQSYRDILKQQELMKLKLKALSGLEYGVYKPQRRLAPLPNPQFATLQNSYQSSVESIPLEEDGLFNLRVSELYRSPFRAKSNLARNPITNPLSVACASPYLLSDIRQKGPQ